MIRSLSTRLRPLKPGHVDADATGRSQREQKENSAREELALPTDGFRRLWENLLGELGEGTQMGNELTRKLTNRPTWKEATMAADQQQQLRVHIRWMIRRDMPEVLDIEQESFEFP